MDEYEVRENLCTRDSRHPSYYYLWELEDDKPAPRKDCACDNCFYGRDRLALTILELQGKS